MTSPLVRPLFPLHSTIPCAPPPRRHRRPRRQRQRPTRHGRWADHPQHYSDRKGPKPEGRPSSSQPYHAGAWARPAPLRATLHTRGMRVLRSSTSTLPPERTREMPRALSENSKARLPVPTPPLILVVVAQVGSPPAPWLVRTLPPTARPLAHQHRPVAGLSAALLRVPPGANAPRVRPTGLVLLVFVHDLPHLPQRGDTRHHPRPQLRDSQAIRSRDANGAGVEMAAAMSVGVGVVHLPAAAAARHAGWRRGGGGLGGRRPSRRAITGATRRDACPTGTGRRARSGRRRGGGGESSLRGGGGAGGGGSGGVSSEPGPATGVQMAALEKDKGRDRRRGGPLRVTAPDRKDRNRNRCGGSAAKAGSPRAKGRDAIDAARQTQLRRTGEEEGRRTRARERNVVSWRGEKVGGPSLTGV